MDDGDGAREVVEIVMVDELIDGVEHCLDGAVGWSNDDDAGVGAGRVAAEVAEASIHRQEESSFTSGGGENGRVLCSCQTLVDHGVDIVTTTSQPAGERSGQVLVEFDPHSAEATVSPSFRARSAAWAMAARMPSRVRLGYS